MTTHNITSLTYKPPYICHCFSGWGTVKYMASTNQNTTACMGQTIHLIVIHFLSIKSPFFRETYWIFWHTYCIIKYTKWKGDVYSITHTWCSGKRQS